MIGYPSDVVYYDRKERAAGESKYPLGKMLAFAIRGNYFPQHKTDQADYICRDCVLFCQAFGFLVWAVVDFYRGNTVSGWASVMVSIWFIGGLLLLSIGIVGEYIGKIYLETKRRPRYLVETRLDDREADTRNDEERSAEDEDREESGTGNG